MIYKELIRELDKKGVSIKEISDDLKITTGTLADKIFGFKEFNKEEMIHIAKKLHDVKIDLNKYFDYLFCTTNI